YIEPEASFARQKRNDYRLRGRGLGHPVLGGFEILGREGKRPGIALPSVKKYPNRLNHELLLFFSRGLRNYRPLSLRVGIEYLHPGPNAYAVHWAEIFPNHILHRQTGFRLKHYARFIGFFDDKFI